jgi:hypothetical protein
VLFRQANHEIGPLRRSTDAQYGIATSDQPLGNRMEDCFEGLVSYASRTGERYEGQREPLADDGDVSGTEGGSAYASIRLTFASSFAGSSPVPER